MSFLPIFLKLSDRPCLVVGGGEIAARKIKQLLKAGGKVTAVSPELCAEVAALVDRKIIGHIAGNFSEENLDNMVLVIAATDDVTVNQRVSALAKSRNIPVNVVDNPELCTFIMPSVVDRNPVQIAISTGGASPVLARLLRARLETMIPASFGKLAELMGKSRAMVKQRFPNTNENLYARMPNVFMSAKNVINMRCHRMISTSYW
jgi:uroporphyrin-III C-methyltransferase/precorrin-2 dehydrogenase/sirohydrochlorin ferrochelatase